MITFSYLNDIKYSERTIDHNAAKKYEKQNTGTF